jgi:transcriptional regulator with XRE-family HTH domain
MLSFKEFMPETLSDIVNRVMADKRLSGYDVERASHGAITQSYVNRIKNGDVKNPTGEKLVALALGLGIAADELFDAVKGKNGTNATFEKALQAAFHDADHWTEKERKEAVEFVRTYADGVRSRRR